MPLLSQSISSSCILTDRYFRRQYGRVIVVIVLFIAQRTPKLALWNDNACPFIDYDHALKIGQWLFDQKCNAFQKSDACKVTVVPTVDDDDVCSKCVY